ncbi:GntR family transcriptional regulator [Pollutimonas harenae]|uniref:GntR family transcriptional regulator n=1 Tax=Pollutimonas harenae TaxID=657015 RepID=A0A853GRX2_9BURK|nr:GntR family transcriptional regulator [Pollutimonas harenae]NYT84907.1 GntR family transcriptional regulator [Pollutimonas harenae]TEA72697.1 GntR family transcriptional regulator [Pollutimonas harenae]
MLSKTVSKTDHLPLYIQIANVVEHEIASGRLPVGAPLPTERQLGEAYGVSRITVREAIGVLKRKELVETRRGAGNFVAHPDVVSRDLLGVHDFDLQIEASGHSNQIELLTFQTDFRSADIATILAVPTNSNLIKVVRVRKADETPLFIETIYLSLSRFSNLSSDDFLTTKLFSQKIRDDYGVQIGEVTLVLDPVLLAEQDAQALHVSELPAAGLLNERTSFDQEGHPVVFSQWLFSRHRCRHLLKIKAK